MNNILVGLDLGTSFVRCVIAQVFSDDLFDENKAQKELKYRLEIIGTAKKPSAGLRNGVIVNREHAMECIAACIDEAQMQAGYQINSCITAIGGIQIDSQNSNGLVAISTQGKGPREINKNDIQRVLDAANAVVFPPDRKMLHVIPQNYRIDGTTDCKNPLGNTGVRLEADVHIITASKTAVTSITQCIERSGYILDGVMLKTLADMHAVMGQDERELGSIIIDLGGGTTDVIVIHKDAPVCTISVPVGGNHVTNDIAMVKGISPANAEMIKIQHGCCCGAALDEDTEVIIPGAGGRAPDVCLRSEICLGIIEPRMREILTMARDEIINKANVMLSGNIILTGGGALMPGVVQLTEEIFGTSAVRIGVPSDLGGIQEHYRSPDFATAVGLVVGSVNDVSSKEEKKSGRKFLRKDKNTDGNSSAPSSDEESLLNRFLKKFF